MAASDHLSPGQFPRMRISQLKRLHSVEGMRVGDHMADKLADVHETEPYAGAHWDSVRGAIRDGTIDPVHVFVKRGEGYMGEGHHRVALAEDMGESSLPVSKWGDDAMRHSRDTPVDWRDERIARRPDLQ